MGHRTTMLRTLTVFALFYFTNGQSFDLPGLPSSQDIRNSKVIHHRQSLCMLKVGSELCYNATKSPGDAEEVVKLITISKYADTLEKVRPQGLNADADNIKFGDDDKSGSNGDNDKLGNNDKTENNENDGKTENNENDDNTENNENDDKTENNENVDKTKEENSDNENVGNTNSDQPIYEDADHNKGDLETNEKRRF